MCAGARKGDVAARKGSDCLQIFCSECQEKGEVVVPAKLNEMMHLIFKIDMSCQQKKASEQTNTQMLTDMMKMMTVMMEKVENLDERMKKIESSTFITHTNDTAAATLSAATPSSSFSNIVQSGMPKSAVVVKPKKKQHSKQTMEKITQAVDAASVNVCSARNARDGGNILCCNNANDTMRVKETVREKLGDDYEVTLPPVKNPRLRITNINIDIANGSIIAELKKHNELIENAEMKLVTVVPRKYREAVSNDVIVEV